MDQIFWILLHSNGFPKTCNRMQTSNILGLLFFFFGHWNIKASRMTSRCFHGQISICFYAKQTISRQHYVRFRTVNFRLHTCCWEPDALPMQMSLSLCYKVLFNTIKKTPELCHCMAFERLCFKCPKRHVLHLFC